MIREDSRIDKRLIHKVASVCILLLLLSACNLWKSKTKTAQTLQASFPSYSSTNKYVGIMYATWFNHVHTMNRGVPPIYPDGNDATWRYWGEPELGRYLSTDVSVINKHADQIVGAGVDFIIVDFTNGNVLAEDRLNPTLTLLDTYLDRLNKNIPTPKVAFFSEGKIKAHVDSQNRPVPDGENQVQALYERIYNKYDSRLFFNHGGRPLLLTAIEEDKEHFAGCSLPFAEKFECRGTAGLKARSDGWSFMDSSPLPVFYKDLWPEEMAVSAAQQVNCMSCSSAHGRRWDFKANSNSSNEGKNFDDQWDQVFGTQPTFVLVRGWNEWTAIRGMNDCGVCYVDAYSPEFSNDIEPMKGGHGNSYLLRMKEQISRYKRNSPNFIIRDPASGSWYFKYGRGGEEFASNNFTNTFPNWGADFYQPFVGDFNDDGRTDVGIRDVRNGIWHFGINYGNGHYRDDDGYKTTTFSAGANYQPFVGDFDNDGKTDIGMRDANTGIWFFWRKQHEGGGEGAYGDQRSKNWEVGDKYEPYVGYFNDDNITDIGMRDKNTGMWLFWYGTGYGEFDKKQDFLWKDTNHPNYRSFVGDFDCDGFTDIGLYDKDVRKLSLANSNHAGSYHHVDTYLWGKKGDYQIFTDPRRCRK